MYGSGMSNQSIQRCSTPFEKPCIYSLPVPLLTTHVQDVIQALYLCVSHPKAANQTFIVSAWATIEEMASGFAAGAELRSLGEEFL